MEDHMILCASMTNKAEKQGHLLLVDFSRLVGISLDLLAVLRYK
jgi:hypothetical protein